MSQRFPLFGMLFCATLQFCTADEMPSRQPQLAAGNGIVAMVFGKGGSVMFAKSPDDGRTFSEPVKIADVLVLALGRHRGPRVVFSGKNILVSATGGNVLATGVHAHGLPSDGNLLVWRSTDGGLTWTKPSVVNDAMSSATEGLHAMTADGYGHVAAAWLDLRSTGTRLYGAFSSDDGITWSRNKLLYESKAGTICQCCDPSLVATGSGEFTVMFRDVRREGSAETRDLYTLSIRGDRVVSRPVKVGVGSWKINGCPMDGGGLAFANGKTITAWRRGEDVFLAEGSAPEVRIGSGTDVVLSVNGSRTAVAWSKAGKVKAWISENRRSVMMETLAASEGGFPALVGLRDGAVLAAWEESGAIVTRRLPTIAKRP